MASFFPSVPRGNSSGNPIDSSNRTAPTQLPLRLLGEIARPQWLPDEAMTAKTYREAVRLMWLHRRAKGMTFRGYIEQLSEAGFTVHAPHVSDWFASDDKPSRRDLPARLIAVSEEICGNRAITQWLDRDAGLTCMEEVIARRAA